MRETSERTSTELSQAELQQLLGEEREEQLAATAGLFEEVLLRALPTAGKIQLNKDETIELSKRMDDTATDVYVIHWAHMGLVGMNPDGSVHKVPQLTTYALYGHMQGAALVPLGVAEKDHDLTREHQIGREKFEISDDEAKSAFIEQFVDKELGAKAFDERLAQLDRERQQLRYRRDHDLPAKPEVPSSEELRTALHMHDILQRALDVQAGQNAQARINREMGL